jgi:heme A synthase
VFLETLARPLLVLHAVLGATTVALATHLVVWTWKALRGSARTAGLRWFGVVLAVVFATQFAVGNLLYPTYKVRVRAEYLDAPRIQIDEARLRARARADVAARLGRAPSPLPNDGDDDDERPGLAGVARLFDVKEHLAALALPFAMAACALSLAWRPERDGPMLGRLLFGCAVIVAASAWFAALVGVWVASYRAVG